jgi:hypothetical protein
MSRRLDDIQYDPLEDKDLPAALYLEMKAFDEAPWIALSITNHRAIRKKAILLTSN